MQGFFGGIISFSINTNILCVNREQTMKIRGGYARFFKNTTWPDHDRLTAVSEPFANMPWPRDKCQLASHSQLWSSVERLRTV